MYNNKLVNDLNKRKVFKKHVYHNDNVEGFTWDDYDTMHYYTNENEDAWFLPKPKKEDKEWQTLAPKHTSCLPKPPSKILLTWNTYKNSKSTQTDPPDTNTQDTQTFPQYYFSQTSRFPGPSSNFNFAPFNPDIIL